MKVTPKRSHQHDKDNVQLNTFVSIALRDRIQHYADLDQRPMSGWVRFILTKHIEALDAQEKSSASEQLPITKSA
jgi:hypothetical protein